MTQHDLARTWAINWKGGEASVDLLRWDKKRVWEYLLEQELLRLIVFVGGEGPRASGMPRIWFPDSRGHDLIQKLCVLATDGRVAYPHGGLSVSHIVPEAIEGGGIASVRPGDWVYLNLRKAVFQIVTEAKNPAGFRPLNQRELKRRTEARKRQQELEHRRASFLPSVRSVFDNVTSAVEGVSPVRV